MSINIQTPNARESDPVTSHLAGDYVTDSGSRKRMMLRLVELVRETPNKTCRELEKANGYEVGQLSKRANEAEAAGLIARNLTRKCSVSGRRAYLLEPVELPTFGG